MFIYLSMGCEPPAYQKLVQNMGELQNIFTHFITSYSDNMNTCLDEPSTSKLVKSFMKTTDHIVTDEL